jgi:hypothetical protein
MFYILPNIKNNIDNTEKGERMFFIVGMSTFTWILIAYIGLHIGAEHLPVLKGITLDYIVANFNLENNHKFILRVRDLFLIVGSIALFIEVAKAATSKSFGAMETLLSFVVAIVFVVMLFIFDWAQNPTFLILSLMSFIDATGGFMIELHAARRDFIVNS